jgi:mRNA interferase RelE/StbE
MRSFAYSKRSNMDEIVKALRGMNRKEQEAILLLMQQIKLDYRKVPGIQALTRMKGWYRVRMGRYRIIFTVDARTKKIEIERISRRNEKTYKGLR